MDSKKLWRMGYVQDALSDCAGRAGIRVARSKTFFEQAVNDYIAPYAETAKPQRSVIRGLTA